MNRRNTHAMGWVLAAVVVAGAAGPVSQALAENGARVSKAAAEKIALEKVPGGKIKSAELEHEKGALVWSFDISKSGSRNITEVLVNANTGAIVEVATETPAQQRAEAREDARAAKARKK